ncbi:uncharacterized protein V1513DRAFT_452833 [Lipomyces chichibuensis]|uniref:uncharacterized protein n=1 Tax=Lipomyces chichibuensis TaxID=1546026 RepID=UPI0033430ADA
MAPPSPTATKSQRVLRLVKTLQFTWFTGHVFVLLGVFFYALSTIKFSPGTKWARFWYRETFISVIVTYGIVLYRTYKSSSPTTTALLRDDNVQYMIIALLWLISKPLLATLPAFAIYSFFHVLTYTRTNVLPTMGVLPNSPVATKIQSFVDNYNDKFTRAVANLELVLLVRLFLDALFWRKGSWISLLVYGSFMRLRFEQSAFTKLAVRNWEVRIDSLIAHPTVPAFVKNGWTQVKAFLKGASKNTPTAEAKTE